MSYECVLCGKLRQDWQTCSCYKNKELVFQDLTYIDELKQQILDAEETIKELSAGIGYKEEIARKYWEKYGTR